MARVGRAAAFVVLPALLIVSGPMEGAGRRSRPEARAASTTNPRAGRAFIVSGADGTLIWTLTAPDVVKDGRFGEAVAGIGDVDGDMIPDVAVGASGVPEGSLQQCGRVYIFSGADGTLLRTVPAPFPAAGIRFGFAIAAAGDVNADGSGDLVVGAPRVRTPGAGRTGAAYVISGKDGTLLATLSPPVPRKGMQFGVSLAAGTDVTGEGDPDIVVGAPATNVFGLPQVGAVFVFDTQGILQASFDDPAVQAGARFGESVAFTGDVTGDGVADLVAGADGQSFVPNDFAGAIFSLSVAGGTPSVLDELFSPTREAFANFGFAVAGLPDLNGDTFGDFAATAPDEDTASLFSVGRGYVLGGGTSTATIADLDDPSPHNASFFGGSMATLPDLTGDGFPELAVGSELQKDPNGVRIGSAYIVEAISGAVFKRIDSPDGDVCARFGWAVASAGDVNADGKGDIVVGAPFHRVVAIYSKNSCF